MRVQRCIFHANEFSFPNRRFVWNTFPTNDKHHGIPRERAQGTEDGKDSADILTLYNNNLMLQFVCIVEKRCSDESLEKSKAMNCRWQHFRFYLLLTHPTEQMWIRKEMTEEWIKIVIEKWSVDRERRLQGDWRPIIFVQFCVFAFPICNANLKRKRKKK